LQCLLRYEFSIHNKKKKCKPEKLKFYFHTAVSWCIINNEITEGILMYRDFFGLKENPFNVTSDPSFLFLSRIHKEAFAHLLYGIRERKGFLEITGEVGAGKTTLCRALLHQLDCNTKTALVFNSTLPEMQLFQSILDDFGIEA